MAEETSQQSRFKLLRKDGFARWQALSTWYRTRWRSSRLFRFANYLVAALLVGWFVLWVAVLRTLPSADSLLTYQPPLPTMVRGNDGEIVSSYARERRVQLRFVDFPEPLINAYLAAEDKTFWTHGGIDFFGLAGAVADYALKFGSGERARGGSTITQQVAKNILIGDEYSISRKLKEMILAGRIEGVLEKQQILELYLNEIPLGRQSFGVQAAARAYFDKDVGDLQLHEAAFLAILPKAPERYGRAKYESMAIERRNWVLDQMVTNGWATEPAASAAKAMPLGLKPRRAENYTADAGYYLEEVRRQLIEKFGEKAESGPNSVYAGGLWVRTSLDTQLQTAAQNSLRAALLRYSGGRAWHGPIAHIDVDGDRWQTELITSNISINYQNWRVGVLLSRRWLTAGKIGFSDGKHRTVDLVSLPDNMKSGRCYSRCAGQFGQTFAVRTIPEVSGGMVVARSAKRPRAGDAGRFRRAPWLFQPRHAGQCASRDRRSSRSSMPPRSTTA